MTWRGPATLGLLVALGAGGGIVASMAMASETAGGGTASPVAAQSPSLPVDPAPDLVADPTTAPLATTLPLVVRRVGRGADVVELSVPRGWVRNDLAEDEWTWRPEDQPKYAYVLRVEQVRGDRDPISRVLANREVALEQDEVDLEFVGETTDSLHFTYTSDDHLRHGLLRWVPVPGTSTAQVEVAISGRDVDVPGMQDLIARVAAGVRME